MSRDYGELEREFIDGLAADTGRDLASWMAFIDTRAFPHRNDMIDWLRQQGLTFAKASRLERIHHNGGRPLYDSASVTKATPSSSAATVAQPPVATPSVAIAPPAQSRVVSATAAESAGGTAPATPVESASDGEMNAFLQRAKGYRPLAELLLRTVRELVPGATVRLHDTHADLVAPGLFAALSLTAKELRLSLDLGDRAFDGELKRLRLPGVAPTLTHTIVINDARRIDPALRVLILAAFTRANG